MVTLKSDRQGSFAIIFLTVFVRQDHDLRTGIIIGRCVFLEPSINPRTQNGIIMNMH